MAENAVPDVLEQLPAGGNPNAPESGTYGEDVSLERLKAALPGVDQGQPAAIEPTAASQPSPVAPGPPGLPSGISAPTAQPGVPTSTRLTESGPQAPGSPEERILLVLDLLVQDKDRSAETRELAEAIRNRIIRAAGQ